MKIIGISAYYHDSAISIIDEGNIIFAAQEERYSRIKHDSNFPYQSIKQGLKYCSISLNEIDTIVFYEKPFLKFERLLETYVNNFLFGFKSFLKSMPLWSKEKLFQKRNILNSLRQIDPNFSNINIKNFCY
jgi:carbamoyltransferase